MATKYFFSKFFAYHFDADPAPDPACQFDADADLDPACHFDADPDPACHFDADPDPSFQIKAQNLEKVLKYAHIPYNLAGNFQIDADADPAYHFIADPDPAYHFDVDPNPNFQFDADPDPQHVFDCGEISTVYIYIDGRSGQSCSSSWGPRRSQRSSKNIRCCREKLP
jgi:hypothetical protein